MPPSTQRNAFAPPPWILSDTDVVPTGGVYVKPTVWLPGPPPGAVMVTCALSNERPGSPNWMRSIGPHPAPAVTVATRAPPPDWTATPGPRSCGTVTVGLQVAEFPAKSVT